MADRLENVIPITSQARSAAEKFGAEHDRNYDIFPAGQRFLVIQEDDQGTGDTELIVI